MEAKAIKKPLQKNIKKMMPKMTPNWSQRGSQNGAKIIKNEVLEAPCFKGGSQVASRAPPGSILERFWDHFRTIFVSLSDIFLVFFACIVQQHVANKSFQNDKESSERNKQRGSEKQLLASCHLASKSSLANVNELSGPCQYRLRQDRCLLLRQGAALS